MILKNFEWKNILEKSAKNVANILRHFNEITWKFQENFGGSDEKILS